MSEISQEALRRAGGTLGDVNGEAALEEFKKSGGEVHDISTDQGRVKWITERWQEERAANAPDNSDHVYDLAKDEDRHAFYAERLRGVEFEDAEPVDEAA